MHAREKGKRVVKTVKDQALKFASGVADQVEWVMLLLKNARPAKDADTHWTPVPLA